MLDNLPRGTICIEDIEMGMSRYLQKVVTDDDIRMFAQISTDHNPVHLDDDYARDTIFEGRIAHGMLTAGLISAVIGEQLPGHGTVYLGQSLKFLAPVRPGDLVHAEVKGIGIGQAARATGLPLRCRRQEGARGRGHGHGALPQVRLIQRSARAARTPLSCGRAAAGGPCPLPLP